MNASTCPLCGNVAESLMQLDAGMRLALQTAGEAVPNEIVCGNCYEDLSRRVSKGVQLRAEQKAKEQNRVALWKSRVNLVRQARNLMEQKAFSEAAVSYEKYLRVLEIVYDLKAGELNPEVFNKSSRSKEVTIIASVYWDLFRIYDTSPRYGERMERAGQKLVTFLPYSTIFPDISRKAEGFARSAKNQTCARNFLRAMKGGRGRCFVATAAYGSDLHPEVALLRRFRDQVLKQSPLGRYAVHFYYRRSPPLAAWLNRHPSFKPPVRWSLRVFAGQLGRLGLKSGFQTEIVGHEFSKGKDRSTGL